MSDEMTSTMELPAVAPMSTVVPDAPSGLQQFLDACRHPGNHKQAVRFLCVGGSGYVVTIVSAYILVHAVGFGATLAFVTSSILGMINNFWWNRNWTFDAKHHHIAKQGMRFLLVSCSVAAAAFGVDKLLLGVGLGMDKVMAEAIAYIIVTPFSFLAQKLWSFKA